jgi:hypothetical protein
MFPKACRASQYNIVHGFEAVSPGSKHLNPSSHRLQGLCDAMSLFSTRVHTDSAISEAQKVFGREVVVCAFGGAAIKRRLILRGGHAGVDDALEEDEFQRLEREIQEHEDQLVRKREDHVEQQIKERDEDLNDPEAIDPGYLHVLHRNKTGDEDEVEAEGDVEAMQARLDDACEGRIPPKHANREGESAEQSEQWDGMVMLSQLEDDDGEVSWEIHGDDEHDDGGLLASALDVKERVFVKLNMSERRNPQLLTSGCADIVDLVRSEEVTSILGDSVQEPDQETQSMLLVANISDECTEDLLQDLLRDAEGLLSVVVVEPGAVDPRLNYLMVSTATGPLNSNNSKSLTAVFKGDTLDEREEETYAWLERVGVQAPDSARALYAQNDSQVQLQALLSRLDPHVRRYALVIFNHSALARRARYQHDWTAVGANVSCRRAWTPSEYLAHLVSLCPSREDLTVLLSGQLGRGLKSLSGDDCACVLLRLDALKPRYRFKRRQPVFQRDMPKMAPLLDPNYQPHNRQLSLLQALVAALLRRVLQLADTMTTNVLARVLRVVTRLENRGLALPAGSDWRRRKPEVRETGSVVQVSEWDPMYGYPGLPFFVYLKLSTMRKGAIMEAMNGCPANEIPPALIERERCKLSQTQRRRRRECSINQYVPASAFKGGYRVKGGYMARKGSGAALRVWAGLGDRRTQIPEGILRSQVRTRDARIDELEIRNFRKHVRKRYGAETEEEVDNIIAEKELMPFSKAVMYDDGAVRRPFFALNLNNAPEPFNSDTSEDSDGEESQDLRIPEEMHAEVAKQGSWEGIADPLFTRWRTHELPPYVDKYMYPKGMPKTTEIHMRNVINSRWLGEAYVDCVGGLKVPGPAMCRRILKGKKRDLHKEAMQIMKEEREKSKRIGLKKGMKMLKRCNITASADLCEKILPYMRRLRDPDDQMFKQGFEREEEFLHDPMRLRGFGPRRLRGGCKEESESRLDSMFLGNESSYDYDDQTCDDESDESRSEADQKDSHHPAAMQEESSNANKHTLPPESRLDQYFLDQWEWDAKFRSVVERLEDPNGPMNNGTDEERKRLSNDVKEQLMGCTVTEFAVLRALSAKARARAEEEESRRYDGLDAVEMLPQALTDYPNLDQDVDDETLRCMILNEKLIQAVEAGDSEEVTRLVRGGAQINVIDEEYTGYGPLHCAAALGNTNMIRVLLGLGAALNSSDFQGCTPLHHAARHGQCDSVRMLVEAGADVMALDNSERPPLHVCAGRGHTDTVKLLISYGADVNWRNELGDTAMTAAACWGMSDTITALVAAGADVNVLNNLLMQPIDFARAYGYKVCSVLQCFCSCVT